MRFSRYVVDNKSHYFASECSRNCVSFAHGYSSNIRSDSLSNGDGEIRTLDPLLARQVLSQLSYTPIRVNLIFNLPVGLNK